MPEEAGRRVERIPNDPTFTRHYADNGLAYYMGRHLELVFLQNGPAVLERAEDDGVSYGVEAERAAVTNVRIGVGGAVGLAMDILDELADVKALKRAEIGRQLELLAQRFKDEDPKGAVGES